MPIVGRWGGSLSSRRHDILGGSDLGGKSVLGYHPGKEEGGWVAGHGCYWVSGQDHEFTGGARAWGLCPK